MTEENTGQIYNLIPKIMGDIGHIGKDKTAKAEKFSYKFRGIEDVYNAVGPVLVKHGVFIIPSVKSLSVKQVTTYGNKSATQIVMEVAYRFYAPDGSFVEAITVGESMDTSDKAANKAMSDAMKYAVWQTFCIPTLAVDSEADDLQQVPTPPQQQAPPPKAPTDPVAKRKAALMATWGPELVTKAMSGLINPETNNLFQAGEKMNRMAEVAEVERLLNSGEVK
jgi:hypothetical protein